MEWLRDGSFHTWSFNQNLMFLFKYFRRAKLQTPMVKFLSKLKKNIGLFGCKVLQHLTSLPLNKLVKLMML